MRVSCIFRRICSVWILLEIKVNKKNCRSCLIVWFDMIISVSKGWLFCHRSLPAVCLFFVEIHLSGWCGVFSSNREGMWSHLPCHLAWPTCEEAVESVCQYSVNIRLSWHKRLCPCYFSSLPICLRETRGHGVRCKVWAMLLLAMLHEGFENNHLRFLFQPHQANSILFQGCSRIAWLFFCAVWGKPTILVEVTVCLYWVAGCPHPYFVSSSGNEWLWNLQSVGRLLSSSWYLLQAKVF